MNKKHPLRVSKRSQDLKIVKRPLKKIHLKNVSPLAFPVNKYVLVPSCFTNFSDWLLHVKPIKTYPNFLANSHSILFKKQSLSFSEIKNRHDQWVKMDNKVLFTNISKEKDNVHLPNFKNYNDPVLQNSFSQKTFTVKIEETITIQLFFQVRRTAVKGTPTGNKFELENKKYCEKVENTRKHDGNSQTYSNIKVSRSCNTLMTSVTDKSTSMCSSDLYDFHAMFGQAKKEAETEVLEAEEFNDYIRGESFKFLDKRFLYFKDIKEDIKQLVSDIDLDDCELMEARKMVNIIQSQEFFHLSMLINRILERNIYEEKKLLIKGSVQPDPLALKVNFNVKIVLHQIARYRQIWDLPITSISINPVNNNVFAVSHGQYFMDQPSYLGRVNFWNLKNISIPEKTANFSCGVTNISFSTECPFALLVSFLNGRLAIVNVVKNTPIYFINSDSAPQISPIWHAQWFKNDFGDEVIITCGHGQINSYNKKTFEKKKLLLLNRREGLVSHGVSVPSKNTLTSKVSFFANIFCFASINHSRYLVGTDDGCVHQCSTDCTSGHLNSFQAHHGPIYYIKFHPDVPKVLLTVGVDYCVRVWALDLFEPLVTLPFSNDFVEEAEWSPRNPTVIVTISGYTFSVWDLRKITSEPCSTYISPSQNRFTTVKFLNGFTVLCGDVYGDVHILGIGNLNFSPICKLEAFCSSIKRILAGNNALLEKLKKLGHPFDMEF